MYKETFISNEYLVSDEGDVVSKKYGKWKKLKPAPNHRGYLIVNLLVDGKRIGVAVHILVARAFCDGYCPNLTVNHIDGNKLNNNASNLEWITNYENVQHAIHVLGKTNSSINNSNSKSIYAYDKISGDLMLEFNCIMDAAKWLKPNLSYKKLRYVQATIIGVAKKRKRSYLGLIWDYICVDNIFEKKAV